MRHFYNLVNEKLNTLDFEAIYPGFRKYRFALYNDTTIWFEGQAECSGLLSTGNITKRSALSAVMTP